MEMRRLACSSLLLNNSGSFSDTPLCHEQYHAGTTLPVSMDRFIRVTGNLDAAIVHRHVPRHFPRSTELLESAI